MSVESDDVTASREAVLIAGTFGSGKSAVAAEMAEILEGKDVPYAAVGLDWLCWAWTGKDEEGGEHRMLLANLAPVVANFSRAGVLRFVLARAVREPSEVESLREVVGMRLWVVRLEVQWPEIERRLRADATAAREVGLREAREWSDGGVDADFVVANEGRAPRETAVEVISLLGW
jgi:hypothetical protein